MGLASIVSGMGSRQAANYVLKATRKYLAKRKSEKASAPAPKPKPKKEDTAPSFKKTESAIERRRRRMREELDMK
jgi:hypothetical protein